MKYSNLLTVYLLTNYTVSGVTNVYPPCIHNGTWSLCDLRKDVPNTKAGTINHHEGRFTMKQAMLLPQGVADIIMFVWVWSLVQNFKMITAT